MRKYLKEVRSIAQDVDGLDELIESAAILDGSWTEPILRKAVEDNHLQVVDLWISAANNVNYKFANKYGGLESKMTPLHVAAQRGHVKIIESLVQNKADVHVQSENHEFLTGCSGTALHHASKEGHTAVVKLLIDSGARVNEKNDYGKTALHCVVDGGCTKW